MSLKARCLDSSKKYCYCWSMASRYFLSTVLENAVEHLFMLYGMHLLGNCCHVKLMMNNRAHV